MQIKHYVVYVARLIEKVCSGNTYCGWGRGGGNNAAPRCNELSVIRQSL